MENRIFIPGSEWVYFKIYTGTKTGDHILKNELYSFVNEMIGNNFIDKWFFIRYTDPDFHLRLRLHFKEICNFTSVFNRFFGIFSPLVNSGFIWNIQCDTYLREMERYGSNSISLIEEFFFIDSVFIIELLKSFSGNNFEQKRWELALVLIDSFLSAFSLSLSQRKELLRSLADSFKKEFGYTHHHITKPLNDKYRFYRSDIEKIMLWENEATESINIIKVRMHAIDSIGKKIIDMERSNKLQIPIEILLESLIHMTMNRWFKSKNRLHEMVIYDFLAKYYTSEIEKDKTIKN